MFTRNEKYGQALHLQYGNTTQAPMKKAAVKGSLVSNIISLFSITGEKPVLNEQNTPLEMTMDKTFIGQAVLHELRNTEAAANENGAARLHEEIA
ncbi:hypothetical protein A9Q83_05130 [Alphaproteobacteria bacterium 46_93_T64]|nr:hypothetical protein A9Q83_05130 [Alphaproteobacteria bacterium 46_93_T64]